MIAQPRLARVERGSNVPSYALQYAAINHKIQTPDVIIRSEHKKTLRANILVR
jgi:hypothetical protein